MRHVGTKWTRQAEELPLHRLVVMTLFVAKVLFDRKDGNLELEKDTFSGQDQKIEIKEDAVSFGETASFRQAVETGNPIVKVRLNALLDVLTTPKKNGKI